MLPKCISGCLSLLASFFPETLHWQSFMKHVFSHLKGYTNCTLDLCPPHVSLAIVVPLKVWTGEAQKSVQNQRSFLLDFDGFCHNNKNRKFGDDFFGAKKTAGNLKVSGLGCLQLSKLQLQQTTYGSKKSPMNGPTFHGPLTLENLIALAIYSGVRW